MLIELLILLAILVEIGLGVRDRCAQDRQNARVIELLEDSNEELADIRDTTVEGDENEQP